MKNLAKTLTLVFAIVLAMMVTFVGCNRRKADTASKADSEGAKLVTAQEGNDNILSDYVDCDDEVLASLVNNKDLPEETMTKIAISNGYKDLYSMEEDLRAKGFLERVPVTFILWGEEISTYKYNNEIHHTYVSVDSEYYNLYLESLE